MTRTFLNLFDAAWFYVEKRDTPAHFGSLIVLSPPPGAPASYVRDLVARWRSTGSFATPFNYVLRMNPIPSWEVLPEDRVDLDHHLRHVALPAPGGERELDALVSDLQSRPLDRRRPLWECHVIEGLADGRFAIFLKLHHGQLDGVAAARLLGRCFSTDPDARELPPPWSAGCANTAPEPRAGEQPDRSSEPNVLENACHTAGSALTAVRALADMVLTTRSNPAGPLVGPFQAPDTVLNRRIGDRRTVATAHIGLARLRRVARAAEVTVNDVFLAVLGGALGRYLGERKASPDDSIIGQVPVNLRAADQGGIGNALSFVHARLGSDIADPLERLRAVHRSTSAAKQLQRAIPAASVPAFTVLLTGPQIAMFVAGLSGRVRPPANLVVSNVPGPVERMYFNGARVEGVYGPSVLFHGQALNVTMSTYAGDADISFTACARAIPDVHTLAEYACDALAELEESFGVIDTQDNS